MEPIEGNVGVLVSTNNGPHHLKPLLAFIPGEVYLTRPSPQAQTPFEAE